MKQMFSALLIVLTLSCALSAQGETKDVASDKFSIFNLFSYEHPVEKNDDEKKWGLNLGAGYMANQGNTESIDLNYSASIRFDNNITEVKLNWIGFYGETKGKRDENRWNAQGNFDHYLIYRLELFSYTMSDYNEIIGLHHRNTSGAGIKFIFIRNRFLLADLSGAPVYQYEKFKDREKEDEWRWSLRWRGIIAPFNDKITLRYNGFYIPEIKKNDNYRLIHDVYLFVRITGYLGIKAGYRQEFNTYTPELLEAKPDLKKTDATSYIQLSVTI